MHMHTFTYAVFDSGGGLGGGGGVGGLKKLWSQKGKCETEFQQLGFKKCVQLWEETDFEIAFD